MFKEVTMYTVICDNCGNDACDGQDFSCWGTPADAQDNAINCDWEVVERKGVDEKHYCPNCFEYGDNDELILKEKGADNVER